MRQQIDIGRLLGYERRLPLRRHQHASDELEPVARGGREPGAQFWSYLLPAVLTLRDRR